MRRCEVRTLIPGCGATNADLVTTTGLWRLYTCHQPATEAACMSMDHPQRFTGEDLVHMFYDDSRILPNRPCHYFLGGYADTFQSWRQPLPRGPSRARKSSSDVTQARNCDFQPRRLLYLGLKSSNFPESRIYEIVMVERSLR